MRFSSPKHSSFGKQTAHVKPSVVHARGADDDDFLSSEGAWARTRRLLAMARMLEVCTAFGDENSAWINRSNFHPIQKVTYIKRILWFLQRPA